ncbi:MAG: Hsp70 family protein [Planctomycetota bacterium]
MTIDFGIDLGTTNSAIAVLTGVEPKMIPNRQRAFVTPSAVWIDKRGAVHVGDEAKSRFEQDRANCDIEFKARMGMGDAGAKAFAAAGRRLLPEELSAEVLKSLRADVQTTLGEDLTAAVITVPAAFELRQTDATRKAAQLAGFSSSPLLTEPVAAALAYGFQEDSERQVWLVYDFGGGTFDAAIIQVREGVIQVVNHAGDNHLGGKLIDWEIVERVFVPQLVREHRLTNFERGNVKWAAAFAKLKSAAEQAKIEVSRTRAPWNVWVENVWQDDAGQSFDLSIELTPSTLQNIIAPYVSRSLNLCRQALDEKNLSGSALSKVLMVGGTSLIPWLREQVQSELRTQLDFRMDPMTVVAQGAAIFAGTQRLEQKSLSLPAGVWRVHLEYEPVGLDEDPEIAGRIEDPSGKPVQGLTLEITEARSQWRSGRLPVAKNGGFSAVLLAEPGRECRYQLEFRDATGRVIPAEPGELVYRMGKQEFDGATLINSLGIAMANNQLDVLVKKGTRLPFRSRSVHRTAYGFRKNGSEALIRIPVVEGENLARADRNRLVGTLEIPPTDIRRDLPAGSEVEITLQIYESRLITTEAWIALLNQHFRVELNLSGTGTTVAELRESLRREKERLSQLQQQTATVNDSTARQALSRVTQEQTLQQIERLLAAAGSDAAAIPECDARLRSLRISLDQAEDALVWPTLTKETDKLLSEVRDLVQQSRDPELLTRIREIDSELQTVKQKHDLDGLRQLNAELSTLRGRALTMQPGFWVDTFNIFRQLHPLMSDSAQATQLIAQGDRAVSAGDTQSLRSVVVQLFMLLPDAQKQQLAPAGNLGAFGGSTQK